MRTAIVSDIHANVDAFKVVLDDIKTRNVDRIICLGDVIGYGPNPVECVDLVAEHCEWSLMGNHDFAVLYEPTNFNVAAAQAAYWTRAQFDNEADSDKAHTRWEFLGQLRVRVQYEGYLCVHGSPRRPINEYIFPDDAINSPVKMQQLFQRVEDRCLVGHTHVPGVFTDEPEFFPPDDFEGVYTIREDEKILVNPGSVGQPRDMDPRASYAILNGKSIEFHRIEYDVEAVVEKIHNTPELSDWLGDRLREGR